MTENRCRALIRSGLLVCMMGLAVGCDTASQTPDEAQAQSAITSGSENRDRDHAAQPSEAVIVNAIDERRRYVNATHGFSLTSPEGWTFMSPDEVRAKTSGLLQPTPSTLVFIVRDANPDDNVNIQSLGNLSRDVPTNAAARRFFEEFESQYPKMMRQQLPGSQVTATRMVDLAGGVAFEAEFTTMRGNTRMKQRSVMLIVRGTGFTIACTSRENDFGDTDKTGFRPILDSLSFN